MHTDAHGSEGGKHGRRSVLLVDAGREAQVDLAVLEKFGTKFPSAGDVRLKVTVAFQGFSGAYDQIWIGADVWLAFLNGLKQFDLSRRGSAKVSALSPDEFELCIRPGDGWGHIVAEGFVGRHHLPRFGGAIRPTRHLGTAIC